jgi:hypothetical protein
MWPTWGVYPFTPDYRIGGVDRSGSWFEPNDKDWTLMKPAKGNELNLVGYLTVQGQPPLIVNGVQNLMETKESLYEALHQLTNAAEYLINRVVETKGVRCVDDTEAAIKLAHAALQRAEGEV